MGLKFIWKILFLAVLAGCSSIPTIVPDMALRSREPVQLDGSHGPLTAKRCKTILEKIKKDCRETNIFDEHLALEAEIAGTPLVVGNTVELLTDGPATYSAMFADMENATDHINLETYIINDDEIGRRFVEILVAKQRAGIKVNLIYDSVGALYTPKEFFKPLIDAGVRVLEFNPVNPLLARRGWEVNRRDHRKLLIVDGRIAFVGGINISSVYASGSFGRVKPNKENPPWRDTHLRIAGPVAAEFQKLFIATWKEQTAEEMAQGSYFPELSPKGGEVVRAIGSSPDEDYSHIYATLLSAINSAQTQAYLTNAYFVPDPQLITALKEAVGRGVDVRLLLPGLTDSSLVYYASRSFYDELLSAGIKIYVRQKVVLHSKTVIIDGVWSTIGSTNLDWRSFVSNQEINAVILGQGFGTKMLQMFEKDLESSKLITLKEWRKRSFGSRLKEQAARLWAYWL